MQKTRMGIAVGLLGSLICFMGLFGGFVITVFLAGYVLLFEENGWLRRSAVKVVALMVFFALLSTVINLIPNIISLLDNVFIVFGGRFSMSPVTNIVAVIISAINIIEKILFIGLGLKALNQGTVIIPVIDRLINKYM